MHIVSDVLLISCFLFAYVSFSSASLLHSQLLVSEVRSDNCSFILAVLLTKITFFFLRKVFPNFKALFLCFMYVRVLFALACMGLNLICSHFSWAGVADSAYLLLYECADVDII